MSRAGYETCEIKWKRTLSWPVYRWVFFAEAIGPRGMYSAGQSTPVSGYASPVYMGKRGERNLAAFISDLTAGGWESVSDKGPEWYSYKFRRVVKG